MHPILVDDDLVGLKALSAGTLDAFITFELYGKYLAQAQGISNLKMTPLPQYNVEYRIAVFRKDPVLASIMNKTLARISNRKKRELDLKWNSVTTSRINTGFMYILFLGLGILLLLVGIIFVWLFLLRKEVERQTRLIREREKEYRVLAGNRHSIILSIPDAMAVTDENGSISEFNEMLIQLLGVKGGDLLKRRVVDILPFKSLEDYSRLKRRSEQMRTDGTPLFSLMATIRSPGGEDQDLSLSGAPIMGNDGRFMGEIWILKDITDQRNIENEVLRSRKMESLALLAGGISHDLNNLLTCLYGFVDLALMTLDEREEAQANLERALGSLDDAKKLTRQILNFSRGGTIKREAISPSRLLSDIAEFSLHGWEVTLIRDFPEDLPSLYADRGQLSQVISNLIINACQAMEGRGEIRLSASVREIRGEPFLRISFKDTGPGIPREKEEEIFKPYYTTKEEGNGLGLASCRSILNRHNGSIELNSQPGQGAEFIIHLPLNESRLTPEQPLLTPKTEKGKTDGIRALIREPNEDIRLIMTLFLREMGYEVSRADTLKETVNQYPDASLIIADVSSEEESCQNSLPREIRKRNPEACIIGATSNPERSAVLTGEQCAYSGCLVKPFSFAEFSETIDRSLQKG